ncbi:MAG: ATP-binding cassette domain-containing protein [Lactobacillales bacterium]|nr:ATP-binding cassette domain-containing protein [Lactobacillales bacterium]
MDKELKVETTLVTKEYNLAKTRMDKIKSLFSLSKDKASTFWALKGVSVKIYSGETIGIIGLNGSGKSTLSNIIAGITPQTSGELTINGEVSIISIAAGLNLNLTGRENIEMKSLMMGETTREIKAKMDEVIEFSELGVFIDQPVKTYSSGMKSKLGFSIAVHQDPDILVIDEALSVGDSTFYNKGLKKMLSFKEQGKTIIFVSQSAQQMRNICDKVIWMHYGEARAFGEKNEVLDQYVKFVNEYNSKSEEEKKEYQEEEKDKQREYSLSQLQNDLLNKVGSKSRQSTREIVKTTTKNKIGDNMSISTKLFTLILVFLVVYFSLAFVKGVSATYSITHPIGTFRRFTQPTPLEVPTEEQPSSSVKPSSSASSTKKSATSEPKKSSSSSAVIETEQYVVEEPDTLETLAAAYNISTEELQALNPEVDFSTLTIGQVIHVPKASTPVEPTGESTYTVQEGDSQSLVAESHGMTVEELQQLNPEIVETPIIPGQILKVKGVTE